MQTLRARVVDGRLRLDEATDLPEGSEVVLAVIDEAVEEALEEAFADMDAGDEGMPADQFLAELRAR